MSEHSYIDIIVPVKNEAGNVRSLVERVDSALKKAHISYHLIFIDDHSTDDTKVILKSLQKNYPITYRVKRGTPGKAFSIFEGAEIATSDIIVMLDADLQYPPEAIPEMLQQIGTHGVIIANRKTYQSTWIRRVASRAIAFFVGRLMFSLPYDIQSGLKMFRKDVLTHINVDSLSPWAFDIPLLYTAKELGHSIGTVDITFAQRTAGDSKVHHVQNAMEILYHAVKLRMTARRMFHILPESAESTKGAGVIHRKKTFITHTTLSTHISAIIPLSGWQKFLIAVILLSVAIGFFIHPLQTAIGITATLSAIYFIDVLFNFYLVLKSLRKPPEIHYSPEEIASLKYADLPMYSILCPLYKEAHVLPQFLAAIDTLDWPKKKLDVQLLLEEDDVDTIAAARDMDLPSHVRITVVPDSQPKTKPKACNYGLIEAKGEYIVIYDAEDMPDPQQLKIAYLAFKRLPKDVVCLQAKLNYYNPHHNWLTRFFTAEYSLWFDVVLNGLQSIETAIPLGGTSNHFRTRDLVEIKAWDPFNVTEDCDLGIRLFKHGYKTAIIDSTTLEEANSNAKNWIRQRSRWIKGYIQTYFVHMRDPIDLTRKLGIHALIFQLVVGGKISFMLINPFLWAATIAYFTLYRYVGPTIQSIYPTWVFYMAAFSLAFGNFLFLYYYMVGSAIRGHWSLIKYVIFIPFYWLMVSIAAAMAIFQFIVKPHYWEKTIHGYHLLGKKKQAPEDQPQIYDVPSTVSTVITQPTAAAWIASKKEKGTFHPFRSLLAGASILILAAMTGNVLNFVYNAYLSRVLSLSDVGLISLFGSFQYISQIIVGAIGATVTYRSAFLYGKYSEVALSFWKKMRHRAWIISGTIAFLWILATPLLQSFFHAPSVIPFLLFAPVWVLGIMSAVDSGFLNGSLKFNILAAVLVLDAATKLLIAILFVRLGLHDLVYAAIPLAMIVSFSYGWMWIKFLTREQTYQETKETSHFPKKFFAASMFAKVSSTVLLSIDVLLAKHYLSPEQAGTYALVSLVGKMMYFVGSLVSQFVYPLVSREEGAGRNSESVFAKIFAATAIVTLSGFVILGGFGQYVVPILLGKRAIPILPYLPMYTLTMVYITLSSTIVSYNQVRKRYAFPLTSVFFAFMEAGTIMLHHESISSFTQMMLITSTAYLMCMVIMHFYSARISIMFENVNDFLGLFSSRGLVSDAKDGKLKILMFNWRDTRHVWAGGAEVYVHSVAKQLVREGNQVTIFCGNDGHHPRYEKIDGITIVRRGGFYTVYLWAFLYYTFRFRGHFDVIIDSANGVPFFTPLYAEIPACLLIHHVHQEVFREHLAFPFSQIAMAIEKYLMPWAYRHQKIITVSESSKIDIIAHNIAKESQITIIHPGIQHTDFSLIPKTSYPSFLYLGRLKAYKNIDTIIRAFQDVVASYPDARLTIAGEGEHLKTLHQLTRLLGLEKKISFIGKITEKEKRIALGEHWVALQPSSFEGWGITVIEANASGTPVIASDVHGLRDSVIPGKTGFLVPLKDTKAFADAMKHMIENNSLRFRTSDAAVKWSHAFSWENSARQLFETITSMMPPSVLLHHSPLAGDTAL